MPHGLPPQLDFAQPDEVGDLEWLLLEVDRLPGCEATKRAVKALLSAQAGRRVYFSKKVLVRPQQVDRARQMMDAGASVVQARDRLLGAGVCQSERVAYRLIALALAQRGRDRAQSMRAAQRGLFEGEALG